MHLGSIFSFFICFLFLFPLSCKLELNHPYDTRTPEYFKTQFIICIVQQFKNCSLSGFFNQSLSTLSYEGSPFVFTKNTTITPVNPSIIGSPTSYSVSPSLPTGLAINNVTGQLSGTPLTTSGTKTYTVTATNQSGSTSFAMTITINVNPLAISGLRFWVKADSLSLANAALVTNWIDQSGNGNSLSPGTSPNFYSSTNTINGLPVVRFLYGPGSTLLKTSPVGVSASDSGSTFIVIRFLNSGIGSNAFTIGTQGAGAREIQITGAGAISMNRSGLGVVASYSAGWTVGIVHQLSILQNAGTSIILRIDGTQVLSTTPASTGYGAGNMGFGFGGAELDIAEALFYDNRVTDQDALDIECYLGKRYATSSCP